MTPFEAVQINQERIEQQDQAANDRQLDGASDAAMGISPQSKDDAYLTGYLSRLRELITTSPNTLQIRWLSPAYVAGGYDAPDCYCEF